MVKNYDPKQVAVIIAGNIASGFSDGTFVMAERNNDGFSLKVGIDGDGTRSRNNDKSGKLTMTFHQSSATNDVLSALADADEKTGTGTFPIYIKDGTGRTIVSALTAWVVKYPSVEYGNEIADRAWVFETDYLQIFAAGN